MLTFAICDDEHAEAEYLSDLVRKWAAANNIEAAICTFDSAESFLFAYDDMRHLDILLLDIEMGEMNGLSLAKHLRKSDVKNNEALHIIFITGYEDFIAEGYDVSALHYLIKPVDIERLFSVLDKAAARQNKPDDELLIQTTDATIKAAYKDIIYIEAFAHYVQITTKANVLKTRANIGDIANMLGDGFVRCHRSYIVGLRHVNHITKTDIVLDSGTAIPLSRRLYKETNQAFIKYHRVT